MLILLELIYPAVGNMLGPPCRSCSVHRSRDVRLDEGRQVFSILLQDTVVCGGITIVELGDGQCDWQTWS